VEGTFSFVESEGRSHWAAAFKKQENERKKMIPVKETFWSKRNLLYSSEWYKPTLFFEA
jgi:hypothetical protein